MATALVGAVVGALIGGGAATAGIITSTAILGSALATGIIGGAVLGGGMGLLSDAATPDAPTAQAQISSTTADKTLPQQAAQLDAAKIGEEESEKRKRKSAKSKFKIEKGDTTDETVSTSGVVAPGDDVVTKKTKTVTGVQI